MRQFGERIEGWTYEGWTYRDRPGAYAIIRADAAIMAVDTPLGLYLPGGGLEPDETVEACLRREVLEETGYDVTVGAEIARAAQYRISLRKSAAFNKFCRFFLAEVVGDPVAPIEPDHVTLWLDPQEAQERLREEASRWAVGRALAE